MENLKSKSQPFVHDVTAIRKRAREHIQCGAVTEDYRGDLQTILKLLNEALATEIVCVLRYKFHYFAAQGILSEPIKNEFQEHAEEEQDHADRIAKRIVELEGKPNFNPEGLVSRSTSQYAEGTSLTEMIEEDLIAERIAIESYRDMIRYVGLNDPTTRRMLEHILAKEEEHAEELSSLLVNIERDKKLAQAS